MTPRSRKDKWAVRWMLPAALVGLLALSLRAQPEFPFHSRPAGHEQNQQTAIRTYEANLKHYSNDRNILVLPGLIADRRRKRVEVLVESAQRREDAPCEFTIIGEDSQHAYESLILAFAKPSAIHQALRFIGKEPGQPADPEALRFWAKGECFVLRIAREGEPPLRLESLVMDRRTARTLPEQGFRFTGSRMVPSLKDPGKQVYAADEYQPMAIVSFFNSPFSVLEVPYVAVKEDVYQNTVINPAHPLTEGGLLTLVIEPVSPDETRPVRDLVLQVRAAAAVPAQPLAGLKRLGALSFQLKDSATTLNAKPSISSALEAIEALDRKRLECFLTVDIGAEVDLGSAQALARILAVMDNERGIRIDAPPAGQLHYRAFLPDRDLLDRNTRLYHPWELSLSEKEGLVAGKLFRVDSVWKSGATTAELEITEQAVSGPMDLRKQMATEAEQRAKGGKPSRPPVIMVFAPSTLRYGQLMRFLEQALPSHKIVHLYLDEPMPAAPVKQM